MMVVVMVMMEVVVMVEARQESVLLPQRSSVQSPSRMQRHLAHCCAS